MLFVPTRRAFSRGFALGCTLPCLIACWPIVVLADEPANSTDPISALPAAPEEASSIRPWSGSENQSTATGEERPAQSVTAPPTFYRAPIPTLPQLPTTPTTATPSKASTAPTPLPNVNVEEFQISTPPESTPLREIVKGKGLALPLPAARIVVSKAERRLDLYSGSTLVKSYPVALGRNPVGAKQSQGDGRTPEGRFYICTRNASTSAFHIFLGLSYPGLPDAKRAVNNKQITWREYQIINQRLASRGRPPWETSLGGWVGIHGGTENSYAQNKMKERGTRDWTAGCVALTNREVEEIYSATKLGTPVEIKP